MDIADKIKFLRTNILDLSQDKFAKKIGSVSIVEGLKR